MGRLTKVVRRIRILGLPVAALTEREAATAIVDDAAAGRGQWTITANLDHLRRYRREPASRQLIEEADVILADGAPLVWASWLAGTPLPQRVAGSSMIWPLCEIAARRRVSIHFLGGDPGAAERAAAAFKERYPDLQVAGVICPPFGFDRDPRQIAQIRRGVTAANPGIVLVGLGFPKQDALIQRLKQDLPSASFVGVGISFSFVAGELSRAPGWAGTLGLEWLYRLLQEPRRLVRRYLVDGLPFAARLLGSAALYRLRPGVDNPRWGPSASS